MLERLLQALVHTDPLNDCVQALPLCQEFAGSVGDKEQHLVAWGEFLWLCRVVINSLLICLDSLQVFLDHKS